MSIESEYLQPSKTPIIECVITRFLEDQVPSVDGEGTDYNVEVVSCNISAGFNQGTATCTLQIKNPHDTAGNIVKFEPMDRVKIKQGWNVSSTLRITFFGFVDQSELVSPTSQQILECRDMLKLAQDNYLIQSNRRVYSAVPDDSELDENGDPMGGQDPEDRTAQAIIAELLVDSGIGTHRHVFDFIEYPDEGAIIIGNNATAVFVYESALDAITRICDLIGYRIWADQMGCVHCREVDQVASDRPSIRYRSRSETYAGQGSWTGGVDVDEDFEWGIDGTDLTSGFLNKDPLWYTTVSGTSVAEIDTEYSHAGTRSARLYRDGTNDPEAWIYHTPPSYDQVVNFRMRADGSARAVFTMGDGTSRVTFSFYEGQDIRYYDDSWKDTSHNYSPNSWYNIYIRNVDWDAKTYDLYRRQSTSNVSLIKKDIPMQTDSNYANQMCFKNEVGTSAFNVDSLAVTSVAGNLLKCDTTKDDDVRNWITVIGYGDLTSTVSGDSDYVPNPPQYRRAEIRSYLLDTQELITAVASRVYTDLNRLRYTANISIEGDQRLTLGTVVWIYDSFATETGMSYILWDYSSQFTAGAWTMDLSLTGGVGTGSEPVGNISPVALFTWRVEREVVADETIWADIFVDASDSYDPDGEFDELTFIWTASGFDTLSGTDYLNTYHLTGQSALDVTLTVIDEGDPQLSDINTQTINCDIGNDIKWKVIFVGSDDAEVWYTKNGGGDWSFQQVF